MKGQNIKHITLGIFATLTLGFTSWSVLPSSSLAATDSTPAVDGSVFDEPHQYSVNALDSCFLSLNINRESIWFELRNPMGDRWTVIDLNRTTQIIELTQPVDENAEVITLKTTTLTPGSKEHGVTLKTLKHHVYVVMQGNPWASAPENPELAEVIAYLDQL